MRHLRTLRIAQGGPVNLAGVAGIRDLVIQVEGVTQVSGEAALGPGSRIERVWDLFSRMSTRDITQASTARRQHG